MAKKYLTPDFDVTSYDINDILTIDVGEGDPDGEFGKLMSGGNWEGDWEL